MTQAEAQVRILNSSTASHGSGRGVLVGVVDSGWDRGRTDPRVVPGIHVTVAGDTGIDDHDRIGHGTTCSRLVLEQAPNVSIVPIRVFDHALDTSPARLIAAIDWATSNGIRLLNLSLGTLRTDVLRGLYDACARARDAGVILVAAARGGDGWSYPAVFAPVIGVGLTDGLADAASIQYRPSEAVECATSATMRPLLGSEPMRISPGTGTSFAAPIVTALIARWIEEFPDLDLAGARDLLMSR